MCRTGLEHARFGNCAWTSLPCSTSGVTMRRAAISCWALSRIPWPMLRTSHLVLRHLREPLTHGPVHPPDPEQDTIRQRAFDLLSRLLHTTYDQRSRLEHTHKDVAFSAWSETDQQRARSLTRLIDDIGDQLYFASGAFERKKERGAVAPEPLTPEQERFYHDAGPVLDTLAKVGLASLSHHLLELLEMFIPSDPAGVFRRIGHVIRDGQKGGYQYESLAVDLMVRLVERYLVQLVMIKYPNYHAARAGAAAMSLATDFVDQLNGCAC